MVNTELAQFLRTRRAQLDPAALGVAFYGRRRVPGLRREELAQLAGVSPTYYTRLEQGLGSGASDSVLDALAHALNLTDDERRHLHRIARPPRPTTPRHQPPERPTTGTAQLVAALTELPVLALDRRNDVLAWNPLAHALLAGHLEPDAPNRPGIRPNTVRMLFLDPHTRELHRDWQHETRRAVGSLRITAGRHPNDPHLAALVGELSVGSSTFAALWAEHPAGSCTEGTKRYHHPTVGDFELTFTVTTTADNSGQRLMMLSAPPHSPSAHALQILRQDSGPTGR